MHDQSAVASSILAALASGRSETSPYRHWLLRDVLPSPVVDAICALPLTPPTITDTCGRRATHDSSRMFFGAEQQRFPVCRALVSALQQGEMVAALEKRTGAQLRGSFLRVEYCLDTDGFWLEPHTDIGAKFFTMLIYLSDPPAGEDWGTDLYAAPSIHVGSAPCARNNALIFVPGPDTWHGFIRRPITGVRRSLIVNYVTPDWRARHELAFPGRAVG